MTEARDTWVTLTLGLFLHAVYNLLRAESEQITQSCTLTSQRETYSTPTHQTGVTSLGLEEVTEASRRKGTREKNLKVD